MKHRYKRKTFKRRSSRTKSARRLKAVGILASVILGLGVVYAATYFVIPLIMEKAGIEYVPPFVSKSTPTPEPEYIRPVSTIATANLDEIQTEIVIQGLDEYKWMNDPYFFKDSMIFTIGKIVDSSAHMNKLMRYDSAAKTVSELEYPLANDHFMYPKFNEKWMVWLDTKITGGGSIMVCDLEKNSAPEILKTVYTGQPELRLLGDYLVWTERTGTRADKLFACDLTTRESVTLEVLSGSYGQSKPFIYDDVIVWAGANTAESGTAAITSCINYVHLSSKTIAHLSPGTYVHDPQYNGRYFAWLTGHHGPETALYISTGAEPVLVAEGVVDFAICKNFVAYGKDETVWVYMFRDKQSYRVSPEREKAQFLGASDEKVIWMDVTFRTRDIMKFAPVS